MTPSQSILPRFEPPAAKSVPALAGSPIPQGKDYTRSAGDREPHRVSPAYLLSEASGRRRRKSCRPGPRHVSHLVPATPFSATWRPAGISLAEVTASTPGSSRR